MKLVARIAASGLLLAGLALLPGAPAQAERVDGPGGMDCAQNSSHTQATSTTEKITLTLKCWGTVTALENNISFQRSGKFVNDYHNSCTNRQLVSPFSCAITFTVSDPSGSQKFETMNEWTIWKGSGPTCYPGGDFPACETARKDGVSFGTDFTS